MLNRIAVGSSPISCYSIPVAHIHEKIDFTVAIFVVRDSKVLLIHHRQLDKWLPLGGHIELDEDPEQAAIREAREESGLEVELIGERPPTTSPGTRALIAPRFLDIHRITDTHEHIGMIYWARSMQGSLTLANAEHHHIRWCTAEDLEQLRPPMAEPVKWYCRKALQEIGTGSPALTEPAQRQPGQRS
jgi:8-oxo-dGTP pyrophosphatase MutT (NUDIX family)